MGSNKVVNKDDSQTATETQQTTETAERVIITANEMVPVPEPSEYNFFTERELEKILANLDTLRDDVYPSTGAEPEHSAANHSFPSVCLIGLGRCGSNIALEVATLVYRARSYYLNEFKTQETQRIEKDGRPLRWIRRRLHLNAENTLKPIFLIEPIVMLGDLDKDIAGRIRYSSRTEDGKFLENYTKMKIMDLSEVHAGGAGNAPILGQYLAKIILNKDTEKFSNQDWKFIHSYLIDSCGIKANQSRLYFYIFSAGGGTGSGMASEFGLAQQYAYMRKTFEIRPNDTLDDDRHRSFVFEPIFTSGICILPNISNQQASVSEALHINAGRLLCKYLSEEWDFSYNYEDEAESEASVMQRIRPWNAMMLISNDIMRYAEETDDGKIEDIDVNSMEKYANQYISQQIFNILTAQAVTTDYDENYFRRAGIDIGETIRLDANDLFMSLAGPVAVAYAESVVPHQESTFGDKHHNIDVDDLFYRSIELPHFNKDTQAIEGISLLPIESQRYRAALEKYKSNSYDASALNDLHFFKNCSSIVSIVSLPKDFKLSYVDLNRLKSHLNALFPNTTLKRYALVIGTSANLSLTTLVAKSPCLSDDFITLIVSYIKRCFAKDKYRYEETLDKTLIDMIKAEEFDESKIDQLVNVYESPAKILDTNWFAIKPMYEKKYRELIRDDSKFQSINDIRLSSENIKKTIRYLREIYRHRISRTKILSLSE
ncbi:hypothetical protein DU002_04565 [Corallincola holothuriorum]|uniref:Uncharacterized protein n=1 Tax=Corallincola holothuriorum TaxID=2282215 RepID=A0A368NMW2_9GAMM|nr:hypothetical protein [Corallincola holothuriorum]RCU51748.1 hypothetical protein DU002_04565 [Corallincola holothuriorum]